MRTAYSICFLVSLALGLTTYAHASEQTSRRPTILVRPEAVVNGSTITLGAIGVIKKTGPEQEKLIESLKAVTLAESPAPKASLTLLGTQVLQAIEKAGIKRSDVGYSIPRTVTITRRGRVVTKAQVLSVLKTKLREQKRDSVRVRDIRWPHDYIVPIGDLKISIDELGEPSGGRLPLRVALTVDEDVSARFLSHATVDHWGDVPVVKRNLERGMLINPEDVQMVRVNLNKQPRTVVVNFQELVGRRVVSRIQAGETVRANQVDIPPTIERGALVTMIYRSNGIEATASGRALTDGLKGDSIVLQNEKSKRVVRAKILSEEEVLVEAQ